MSGRNEVTLLELRRAIRTATLLAEKNLYREALLILKAIYAGADPSPTPDGLSLYGLCLALADKKTKAGIALCEQAMKQQPYESSHWLHLIAIYRAIGSRKRMVELLDEALHSFPEEPKLQALRDQLGYRRRNPIPLLGRDNPLNSLFGKMMRRR
jgi:tetratricopeptide (TPR) repeat protein